MPHITIIIPTYNSSRTITRALDSIIFQKFNDFEILIIDGMSTDKTVEIAKDYNDNRIIIHAEKDHGIYDAMNKGINLANGSWIYFLGSDDRLYSDSTLENVSIYTNRENCDVIYGNVVSAKYDGFYDGEFDCEKLYIKNICHQSIFFKKNVFKTIGKFNLKYKSLADWDHNIRWFLNNRINKIYINEVIAEYADGGFSSINNDYEFMDDKNYRFIYSGLRTLPLDFIIKICRNRNNNNQLILRYVGLFSRIIYRLKKLKIYKLFGKYL